MTDFLKNTNTKNIIYITQRELEGMLKISLPTINKIIHDLEEYEYPIELVSLLILNEIEGNALTGKDEPNEIIDGLKAKYPNTDVLLTLGKDGAVFFDGEKRIKHGIYKTNVVDTTAAGDTVLGYFVAEMSKGLTAEKALELASRASSITVSRPGAAVSIPDEDEVLSNNFEYLG